MKVRVRKVVAAVCFSMVCATLSLMSDASASPPPRTPRERAVFRPRTGLGRGNRSNAALKNRLFTYNSQIPTANGLRQSMKRHYADVPTFNGFHGVFDSPEQGIALMQEAYERYVQNAPGIERIGTDTDGIFMVPMGRRIGYLGGTQGLIASFPAATHIALRFNGGRIVSATPARPTATPISLANVPASRALQGSPIARRPINARAVPRIVKPGGAARLSWNGQDHVVQVITFDLDGTVFDAHEDIAWAADQAFREMGIVLPSETVIGAIAGAPLNVILARGMTAAGQLAAGAQPTQAQIEQFSARYVHYSRNNPSPRTHVFAGIARTFRDLRRRFPYLHFAVATARDPENALSMLQSVGMDDLFSVIAGSGGTPTADKPSPEMLNAIADHLGIAPSEMIMVGDAITDVRAGQNAGGPTVAVTTGVASPEAMMQENPTLLISDMQTLLSALRPLR